MRRLILSTLVAAMLCFNSVANTASPVECDRDCLAGFMNTYLKALLAHDSSKLPVTKNVKYTENGVRLNLSDGLWHTASAIPTYRVDVIDEKNGQVGLLGRIDLQRSGCPRVSRARSKSPSQDEQHNPVAPAGSGSFDSS